MEMNEMKSGHLFDPRFLAFYQPLHEKYTPWQRKIAYNRIKRTHHLHQWQRNVGYKDEINGWLLSELDVVAPEVPEVPKDFKIELPVWCQDQRNQMTGPADDAALVVKMLNSGAPGVMIDLEDSQANNWDNTSRAYGNLFKLFRGQLSYDKGGKEFTVNYTSEDKTSTVLWIRPRGLHMTQVMRFPMALQRVETSASLLDVAIAAYNFSSAKLPCTNQPLAFYIPKSEYAEEALWWAELFKDIAKMKGWAPNTIKCMALVEAHSLAYQAEEFVYNLRDHILGLNLGRWDYMASLIEQNLWDSKWVLPDRNTIPHDVAFFQNLRKQLVNVCHRRGILAIGGMTALYPSRKDAKLNDRALKSLKADKANEAAMGMDGAWTGHPDQNQIAVDQFPYPNQLHFKWGDLADNENYDLRPPIEGGRVTEEGTRNCIRVAIRYRNGVLNGKGASLLDGYMEDLATDRICRMMIAQRMLHLKGYEHAFIAHLFDEELEKLIKENKEIGTHETLRKARVLTYKYIINGFHNPN